jgi:carbamoyltransferase
MIILGLNGVDGLFHDASASLVVDGRLVASVEEERFNRKKHTNGLPVQAIDYCLRRAGITFSDVDHIGYYLDPAVLRRTFVDDIVATFAADRDRLQYYLDAAVKMDGLRDALVERLGPTGAQLHFLNHHLTHASCAFYPSGFDEAAVLTLDGSGDRETATLYHGLGLRLEKVRDVLVYPQSLGFVYTVMSAHLGLGWIEGPGKLMGLAAYAAPDPALFADVVSLRDNPDCPLAIDLSFFDYHLGGSSLTAAGLARFGPARAPGEPLGRWHEVVAASTQQALEEAILHVVRMVPGWLPGCRHLCFAGGIALNVTTNRRILDLGLFDSVFVPPPAYDGGTLYLSAAHGDTKPEVSFPYTGPDIDEYDIAAAIACAGACVSARRLDGPGVCQAAAEALAAHRLVGWVQGRMECGPRALGNRSILANPTLASAKDDLNTRVKLREPFRPYAPAVLRERAAEWFDLAESPYMLLAAQVHAPCRARVPAIVHVDGSARPQTVTEADNPRFHRLITAFAERTGIPMVLNTSFNRHGEPLVNTPEEAIAVLLETGLDDLFIGDHHVVKAACATG